MLESDSNPGDGWWVVITIRRKVLWWSQGSKTNEGCGEINSNLCVVRRIKEGFGVGSYDVGVIRGFWKSRSIQVLNLGCGD